MEMALLYLLAGVSIAASLIFAFLFLRERKAHEHTHNEHLNDLRQMMSAMDELSRTLEVIGKKNKDDLYYITKKLNEISAKVFMDEDPTDNGTT